jgi:two-component system phosphate regulon sensor histidine kinase PhoR
MRAGWSVRYSDTLRYEFLYTARKIIWEGQLVGLIRLAIPLKDVNESINTLRLKINLVVISIFLLTGIIIIRQMERIRKFVNQIAEYAGAIC